VQLALRRDIEHLLSRIERQQKAIESASKRIYELENQLLALTADRDSLRIRFELNAKLIGELERMIGLQSRNMSWEERRARIVEAIAPLRAYQPAGSKVNDVSDSAFREQQPTPGRLC